VAGVAGGLSSARGRREGRKEREGEKKKKENRKKKRGKERREREREKRDRARASEIRGGGRGLVGRARCRATRSTSHGVGKRWDIGCSGQGKVPGI
jgi:hypothetical protein